MAAATATLAAALALGVGTRFGSLSAAALLLAADSGESHLDF